MACRNLYAELCSFRNLELAYRKARKNKRYKRAAQKFEFNLEFNLLQLKHELETLAYKPMSMNTFVIRDPKTRVISASHFRDRIVHHALCNIIEPIFERIFIHDSYANRINKGTHKALERFDTFKRRMSQNGRLVNKPKDNNMVIGYVLKADIRHYFDTVDHKTLMETIKRRIKDRKALLLIQKILDNHTTRYPGKGMPIGNLTSQFFANLYLNKLDYFVKHELRAKYYIRYVDDFVILHKSREKLLEFMKEIAGFLGTVKLELHPQKSRISPLHKGTNFLGYRVFYHYKLLRKSNMMTMERRIRKFRELYDKNETSYGEIIQSLESWMAYSRHADSYNARKDIMKRFNAAFILPAMAK